MMKKKKTTQLARLKLLLVLPLVISMLMVISFSSEVIAQQNEKEIPPPPPKADKAADTTIDPPSATPISQEDKETPVYTVVEVMPTYIGGDNAMYKYLGENIKYPENAKKYGISGTVYISFVIKKDGSVSGVKILRGIGGGCDEEAIRVIEAMPKWNPGKQRGKQVDVAYNLPIKFTLDEKKKEDKK